jgi:hypothetical protein
MRAEGRVTSAGAAASSTAMLCDRPSPRVKDDDGCCVTSLRRGGNVKLSVLKFHPGQANVVQELHKISTCKIKKEGMVESISETERMKGGRIEGTILSQIETEGVWAMTYNMT